MLGRPVLALTLMVSISACTATGGSSHAEEVGEARPTQTEELALIRNSTELATHVERRGVRVAGTFGTRSTLYWGGPVPSLTLRDGTVVPLRVPEGAQVPAEGENVVLAGTLSMSRGLEGSVTQYVGDPIVARDRAIPMTAPAYSLELGEANPAQDGGLVDDQLDLAQVARRVRARFEGTLVPAELGELETYVLVSDDGMVLPIRYVVDARDQVAALANQRVVLRGAAVPAEVIETTGTLAREGLSDELSALVTSPEIHASWVIEMRTIAAG